MYEKLGDGDSALQRELRAAHEIKILNGRHCYKPELWRRKGWSKLADDRKKWGFCSSSCKVQFMKVQIRILARRRVGKMIIL